MAGHKRVVAVGGGAWGWGKWHVSFEREGICMFNGALASRYVVFSSGPLNPTPQPQAREAWQHWPQTPGGQ